MKLSISHINKGLLIACLLAGLFFPQEPLNPRVKEKESSNPPVWVAIEFKEHRTRVPQNLRLT